MNLHFPNELIFKLFGKWFLGDLQVPFFDKIYWNYFCMEELYLKAVK